MIKEVTNMERIIQWFIPKEDKFFDMLKEQSNNVLDAAMELQKLVLAYHKLSINQKKKFADKIRQFENKGDDIAHKLLKELDTTFITPLDKEDIHRLTGLLDDIIDFIDDITESFVMFNITKVDPFIKSLVHILVNSVVEVDRAILNFKKLKNMDEIYIKINNLENESDRVYYNAMSSLFRNGKDPIDIIKYKDIYKLFEDTIDRCEDVTYVIGSIVVKHV